MRTIPNDKNNEYRTNRHGFRRVGRKVSYALFNKDEKNKLLELRTKVNRVKQKKIDIIVASNNYVNVKQLSLQFNLNKIYIAYIIRMWNKYGLKSI